jgi:hypothetical protein
LFNTCCLLYVFCISAYLVFLHIVGRLEPGVTWGSRAPVVLGNGNERGARRLGYHNSWQWGRRPSASPTAGSTCRLAPGCCTCIPKKTVGGFGARPRRCRLRRAYATNQCSSTCNPTTFGMDLLLRTNSTHAPLTSQKGRDHNAPFKQLLRLIIVASTNLGHLLDAHA